MYTVLKKSSGAMLAGGWPQKAFSIKLTQFKYIYSRDMKCGSILFIKYYFLLLSKNFDEGTLANEQGNSTTKNKKILVVMYGLSERNHPKTKVADPL